MPVVAASHVAVSTILPCHYILGLGCRWMEANEQEKAMHGWHVSYHSASFVHLPMDFERKMK